MVLVAEAHERAVDAAGRRHALDLLEAVADAGARQVRRARHRLADQPAHVVRAAPDRAARRRLRLLAQRRPNLVLVGDAVDVDPALPALAPVGPGITEHERRVGDDRQVPAQLGDRQRHGAGRDPEPEVHERIRRGGVQSLRHRNEVLGER